MDQNIKKGVKRKIVEPAKEELLIFKKTAEKQITGGKPGKDIEKDSPIVEAMKASGKPIDPGEVQKIRFEMKKRARTLEEEIEREKRKRQERDRQRAENQQQEEVVVQPGEPLEIPASKPSRGMLPGTKQKTPEVMKSKK